MADELELEPEQEDEKPRFRDRNRGRSQYIRSALVKIFRMSPEERATFQPKNGFEEAALKHLDRCQMLGPVGNSAMNFALSALGEMTSKNPKEEKDGSAFSVVDDLPRAPRRAN